MKPELLKAIDPIVRRFGLYTSYRLDEQEYVGHADGWNIKKVLRKSGYESSPTFLGIRLQAAKLHPTSGRVHDWSLRKVDPENNRKQYHVHAWDDPDQQVAMLYSHHEYRPDVRRVAGETYGEMIERLRTHYSPEWGTSEYQQGKMDSALRELIE